MQDTALVGEYLLYLEMSAVNYSLSCEISACVHISLPISPEQELHNTE